MLKAVKRPVLGFHFVCPKEVGVEKNADGTAWTGIWVVSSAHAARAPKVGAYVALHAAKAELSYMQGMIKDWRSRERNRLNVFGQEAKTRSGVDFLFEPDNQPRPWRGGGSGEKGYYYGEDEEPRD